MNIRATSDFRPGNLAAIEAKIVPRIIAAVQSGTVAVKEEAIALVPVDTGELRDSISAITAWEGQRVTGSVVAAAPHAAYVEFGTGIRGASSPGSGPGPYSPTWPGMPAQPYLRPALDGSSANIFLAFQDEGFQV